MKKGVSLISLIITIVVIIILASIAIYSSFDVIEQANLTKLEKEFNDVVNYVRTISTKLEAGIIDVDLTGNTLITTDDKINEFYVDSSESELTAEEANNIKSYNSGGRNQKRGYYYITASQIENGIPGLEEYPSNLDNVTNNYIINFYYGTVIAKVSPEKTNVSGMIK